MNVLFVNLARMGDLVQITPAAVGLKAEQNARVTLLAPMRYAEFARRLDGVDEVIGFDDSQLKTLDDRSAAELVHKDEFWSEWVSPLVERRFDTVVNLTHDQFSTAFTNAVAADKTLGRHGEAGSIRIRGTWFRYFYAALNNRTLNPFNLCDIYRRGVGVKGHYPVSMTPSAEDIEKVREWLSVDVVKKTVLLHPGANHPLRRWPVDRFAQLASKLYDAGIDVRILAGQGERDLGNELADLTNGNSLLLPEINVDLLPALMSQVDLLVTNDTGPLHIAASVGTKTVSVFLGMARPQDTAPFREGQVILESTHPEHPAPEHPEVELTGCSTSVPVDAVIAAAKDQLKGEKVAVSEFPSEGLYRVLETHVAEDGGLDLIEQFNLTGRDLDAPAKQLSPVWKAMLDDAPLSGGENGFQLDEAEGQKLTLALRLGETIYQRLMGANILDDQGRSLTIRDLESLWLSLEQEGGVAAALMLPQRLERESLYTRGIDAVKAEFETRFNRWLNAVRHLAVPVAEEAMA